MAQNLLNYQHVGFCMMVVTALVCFALVAHYLMGNIRVSIVTNVLIFHYQHR